MSLVRLLLLSPCPHFQLQPTYFFTLLIGSERLKNKNPHLSPTFSVRSTSSPARGVTNAAGYPYSSQLKRCCVRYSSPHIALYQPQPPDWSGTAKSIHLSLWWQHARRKDSAPPTLVQTPGIHFFTLWRIIVRFVGCCLFVLKETVWAIQATH